MIRVRWRCSESRADFQLAHLASVVSGISRDLGRGQESVAVPVAK